MNQNPPPTKARPASSHPASARAASAWAPPTLIPLGLFLASLALYLSRIAPSVVPGDPGEYQLVAARWGIAHPPGYGLYALLGNLFTHLVPFGTFAWRANLFSAVCAAAIVVLAYGIGRTLSTGRPASARALSARKCSSPRPGGVRRVPEAPSAFLDHFPSLFGALVLATGIDLWQHAIHANAHILTALLATCTLYLLLRWWRTGSHPWLYAAAFLAGLSPVQHPLLVFAFPAYLLFGLAVLPNVTGVGARSPSLPPDASSGPASCPRVSRALPPARTWQILATTIPFALLGLTAYLYYPIRSAIGAPPMPGPTDMHTWSGFVRVVTAQGLRGNLGGFTLLQVLQRLWDVRVPLRLQYTVPGLFLAAIGFVYLWCPRVAARSTSRFVRPRPRRAHTEPTCHRNGLVGEPAPVDVGASAWQPALLLTAYLACILLVTVNVLQDQMAYLLGPMVVVGVLIGLGIEAILVAPVRARILRTRPPDASSDPHSLSPSLSLLALAALLLPIWSLALNWQRMDLHDFRDADLWLQAVESRFVGQGQRAALLTEWERMTTVYYYAAVEGRTWDEHDLRFVPIFAGTEAPFLQASDENLPLGPVYLTTYRPEVAARYRLMPSGNLWQVLPAWPRHPVLHGALPTDGPLSVQPVHIAADPPSIEIVGWTLDRERVRPGDVLLLDLYMRFPPDEASGPSDEASGAATRPYYLPWARLGDTTYHFTTDSRFNTPWWQPGEIVVERFELPVPWSAPPGPLSLQVGLWLVNEGRALDLEGGQKTVALTELQIEPAPWRPSQRTLQRALGNLRGDILLREARVNGRSVRPLTVSARPVSARPGTRLRVVLEWESLRPIDENLKVFVQLLDANLQVRAQGDDKAPLGGSAPTWLWFPRWRRGTRITDTYLLDLPSDLPPGSYPLVVGMYGFSTFKRVQALSPAGDVEGDWITLTHLHVGAGSSHP